MDLLDKIDNALDAYHHALDLRNGSSAFSQRLYIEQNCDSWLGILVKELRSYRKMTGITADIVARIAAQNEKPLEFVYVCSPSRGNVRANINAARQYCAEVLKEGYIPIAPHVMFYGILYDNIPEQRQMGLEIGIRLLPICRELRIYGTVISSGMRGEIKQAGNLKIPIIDKREVNHDR